MALFMAKNMMDGKLSYEILRPSLYRRYKNDVDVILVAEGRADLIIDFDAPVIKPA